jgi:hypothetical protein
MALPVDLNPLRSVTGLEHFVASNLRFVEKNACANCFLFLTYSVTAFGGMRMDFFLVAFWDLFGRFRRLPAGMSRDGWKEIGRN